MVGGRPLSRDAFTLVEVLVVVVIIAALAATIIPHFSESTIDAKRSTLQFNLHTLRSQIELYRTHHGVYPELANATLPQLLTRTDANGNASRGSPFGPYLDSGIPVNPFDNKNRVVASGTAAPVGVADAGGGWQYDQSSGGIWPNHTEYWRQLAEPSAPGTQ